MSDKTDIDRNLPEFVIVGPAKGDRAKVRSLNRWATYDGENWVIGKGEKAITLPHGVDPEGVTKQFIANVLNNKAAQDYEPDDTELEDTDPEPGFERRTGTHLILRNEESDGTRPVVAPVPVPVNDPEVVEIDELPEWDREPSAEEIYVQRENDALVDLTPRLRKLWTRQTRLPGTEGDNWRTEEVFNKTTGVRVSTETSVLGPDELAFRMWLASATDDELKTGFNLLNDAIALQSARR